MMFEKKILVTGSNGLVGKALQRNALSNWFWEFSCREDTDLENEEDADWLFYSSKPNYVIHTAAFVGGVGLHLKKPVDLFRTNIRINSNVLDAANATNVEKLIAFSSICAYPDHLLPIKEEYEHIKEPHPLNFSYAYAKRMISVEIEAYRKQFNRKNWCVLVPVNIYGPNDNYDLEHAHIIPSLLHKIYLAKKEKKDFVVWGDGSAKREFVFSDDLARITIDLLHLDNLPHKIIISSGVECSIAEIVDLLVMVADFRGKVVYDKTKPNGQLRRPTDTSLLKSIFPNFKFVSLEDGLRASWDWFNKNHNKARFECAR